MMIVAMAGLPGTGKSTLAMALAAKLSALVLNKDALRAALFPAGEIEYSTRQDDFVVGIMLQVAEYSVQKDPTRCVILDGRTFSHKQQVDTLLDFSQKHGWDLRFIYCVCSDEVARARLEHAAAAKVHLAADRDFNLYLRIKAQSDPLQVPHLRVDTGEGLKLCTQRCLDYLNPQEGRS